jgi:hypothetical protein
MSTQIATETVPRERASARSVAVAALGPLAIAAGVVWGLVQPERVTLLHPRGQGFWWLLAEPPLLLAVAGALFALLLAPGLRADLDGAP